MGATRPTSISVHMQQARRIAGQQPTRWPELQSAELKSNAKDVVAQTSACLCAL